MGKAEVGSTKHLSNKIKSKGLQRLRWFCQVCEKQCRDENGFKMHTQSESHVRQILVVGADPKKFINQYSNDFMGDFVQLLKTAHGTKQVQINHFYQEYISNKEHVHMNATKWPNLTEFAKHLGREGICKVEEVEEKGIYIGWLDNSPDALKRQDQLRKKEMLEKGDEETEQMIIREQIRKAQSEKEAKRKSEGKGEEDELERERMGELKREDGQKVVLLAFGAKNKKNHDGSKKEETANSAITIVATENKQNAEADTMIKPCQPIDTSTATATAPPNTDTGNDIKQAEPNPNPNNPLAIKMGSVKPQAKNVFKQAKKAFGSSNSSSSKKSKNISSSSTSGGGGGEEKGKKMSEAERIMREEIERKRVRDSGAGFGFAAGSGGGKRQKRF